MVISSETAGKVTVGYCYWLLLLMVTAVCRKGIGSSSIFSQFCRCWVYKKCSVIRGKLKKDCKFKCQTCANQQTDIGEDFSGKELNGQSLEIVEKFCYLSELSQRSAVDSVITRIRSGWNKFRDLVLSQSRFALRSKRQTIFCMCTQHYVIWE